MNSPVLSNTISWLRVPNCYHIYHTIWFDADSPSRTEKDALCDPDGEIQDSPEEEREGGGNKARLHRWFQREVCAKVYTISSQTKDLSLR